MAEQKTTKVDFLKSLEREEQAYHSRKQTWVTKRKNKVPKYFITTPYPYTNGKLHLGHSFTYFKADIVARFKRVCGFNVLFPFAFHGTGTPIYACTIRLKEELGLAAKPTEDAATNTDPKRRTKAKLLQKKGAGTQKEILMDLGVSEEDLVQFTVPEHYLYYFAPLMERHLVAGGFSADFSRKFFTTDLNPYYDAFVRWQFDKLKAANKLVFGKRPIIFSPKDEQPCGDEERRVGEGVQVAASAVLLFRANSDLFADDVFLLVSTTRAETVFGATNLFLNEKGTYFLTELMLKGKKAAVLSSEHALKQLSYQEKTTTRGTVKILRAFSGKELLATVRSVTLPELKEKMVYAELSLLNNLTVDMDKGTGFVMSVPADNVFDFVALKLVHKSPLSIPCTTVAPNTEPDKLLMEELAQKHKLVSANQTKTIEKMHADHFALTSKNVMALGPFKGVDLQTAREKTLALLSDAFSFYEPEERVVSRTGNECVAALIDSWSIDYGNKEWKQKVREHAESMEFYNEETRERCLFTVDWLDQWSCSRSHGLGSRLPFDERYLIDSLSDSTIYMALYPIYPLLQQIPVEKLGASLFEFVFNNNCEGLSAFSEAELRLLEEMRAEFAYWYGVDCRVSGKELIMNHLTMALFNHTAVWPNIPQNWPKSYFCNGHLLLNNKKMSKSTGNFLTLEKALDLYGADAIRLTLADGGDFLEDSNFAEKSAVQNGLRLFNLLRVCKERLLVLPKTDVVATAEEVRERGSLWDKLFLNNLNRAVAEAFHYYEAFRIREAVVSGFFELQNYWTLYCKQSSVVLQKLEFLYWSVLVVVLAPVAPHVCDNLFRSFLGRDSVFSPPKGKKMGHWPKTLPEDRTLTALHFYLKEVCHTIRTVALKMDNQQKLENLTLKKKEVFVLVRETLFEWQVTVKKLVAERFEFFKANIENVRKSVCALDLAKEQKKNAIGFAVYLVEKCKSADELDITILPFDELRVWKEHIAEIRRVVALPEEVDLVIQKTEKLSVKDLAAFAESSFSYGVKDLKPCKCAVVGVIKG